MVESQPGPLAARHENNADFARREGLLAAGPALVGRETVLGRVQAKGRRLPGPQGQIAEVALVISPGKKPLDQGKIDLADLRGQRLTLRGG